MDLVECAVHGSHTGMRDSDAATFTGAGDRRANYFSTRRNTSSEGGVRGAQRRIRAAVGYSQNDSSKSPSQSLSMSSSQISVYESHLEYPGQQVE